MRNAEHRHDTVLMVMCRSHNMTSSTGGRASGSYKVKGIRIIVHAETQGLSETPPMPTVIKTTSPHDEAGIDDA